MSKQRPYRGKPVAGGEMVYGWYAEILVNLKITSYIILDGSQYVNASPAGTKISGMIEVIPSSVGQSTGLKDRKGEEVFQGDIVRIMTGQYLGESPKYRTHTVVNPCPACAIPCPYVSVDTIPQWEVIGNTTDNPELLEKQT